MKHIVNLLLRTINIKIKTKRLNKITMRIGKAKFRAHFYSKMRDCPYMYSDFEAEFISKKTAAKFFRWAERYAGRTSKANIRMSYNILGDDNEVYTLRISYRRAFLQ